MDTYNGWTLLDEMPDGWRIDKSAGSPLTGYEFVTNGKSILSGHQKRALLLVVPRQRAINFDPIQPARIVQKTESEKDFVDCGDDAERAKTVNDLARAKFKHKILADILVDLTICEIEGWDKMEYISDLQQLIGGIGRDVCSDA